MDLVIAGVCSSIDGLRMIKVEKFIQDVKRAKDRNVIRGRFDVNTQVTV